MQPFPDQHAERQVRHATRTEDLHTPLPEGERLLPSDLQAAGYFTGHMAKRHYGPNAARQFERYSEPVIEGLPRFLDSAGTRPFFRWAGFLEPHRPYERARASRHAPARVPVPPHLADTPETRADLVRYYDEIALMDDAIGEVMAELGRRRLVEDTLSCSSATTARRSPGRSVRDLLTAPDTYAGGTHVFSERNGHDCDEHQRAVRTGRFKLIRTDAYTGLPLCNAADIGASPSFKTLLARARAGRLTAAQHRLFEAPRARIEVDDLESDPWEIGAGGAEVGLTRTAPAANAGPGRRPLPGPGRPPSPAPPVRSG